MELTTILLLIFSILTLLALAAVLVLLAVPRRPKGLTDLERELRRDLQSFGDMITDNQHDANMLQEQRFANFERASGTRLETLSDKVQRMSHQISTIGKTCWQYIYEIIQLKGISKPHFCNLTGLGEEVYRKAEKNLGTDPSLRTIVAIACGLSLDIETTEKMLHLAGHAFKESNEHRALKSGRVDALTILP